ncbi:MAG: MBL fold metallo-hydrolase [Myxococcota bacterium]
MKSLFKVVGIILAVLGLAAAGLVASVLIGRPAIPDGLRLDGVQVVQDGYVAAYLVDLATGGVALVDAGSSADAGPILTALQARGLTASDVHAVLLTHGDPDHIAGALQFTQAPVMVLAGDADLVEGRALRGPIGSPKPTGIRIGRTLKDGEVVTVGGTSFEIFAIPGHSRGSAAILARGTLFLGDSAETDTDGRLHGCSWLFCSAPDENRRSLTALAGRLAAHKGDVRNLACSHSGVLVRGVTPLTELVR